MKHSENSLFAQNVFVHPQSGQRARAINYLMQQTALRTMRRAMTRFLPFPVLQSEIQDVIYLNWVLDLESVQAYVPPGVSLWQRDGKTLFTILTYVHGHFGPVFFGPLRQLCPSPIQSNWRLYVSEIEQQKVDSCVLFVKNTINHTLYAVGSRLFSDALPSHLALACRHQFQDHGFLTEIDSGQGSSPDLYSHVELGTEAVLPLAFQSLFGNWHDAIRYLCLQDSAIAYVGDLEQCVRAGIELPIDINSIQAARLRDCQSHFPILQFCALDQALCFRVPRVRFRALWEKPC